MKSIELRMVVISENDEDIDKFVDNFSQFKMMFEGLKTVYPQMDISIEIISRVGPDSD